MIKVLALVAALACLTACAAPAAPAGPAAAPASPSSAHPDLPPGYDEAPERTAPCGNAPTDSLDPAAGPLGPDGRPDGPNVRRVREEGLRVGVSQTGQFRSKRDLITGELSGLEIDIAKRVAAALGVPDEDLSMIGLPTGGRLYSLDTGANRAAKAVDERLGDVPGVDLVIAGVSVTACRVETHGLRFSRPYMQTHSGLLVRAGLSGVTRPEDLAGRKVCSGAGTTNSDEMIDVRDRQRAERRPELVPVAVNDTSDCLMLMQRGFVDAVYSDVLILHGYRHQDPGTVLLDYRSPLTTKAAVAVSGEQDDLLRFANDVLDDMRADGSLDLAYDTWFQGLARHHRLPVPDDPYRR
ncbi:transporter substrate-binding domain-containing protein [Saccharothrix xinjiangensis]|uniref:Transporter substrate-binding domain-containing protein n=1 Tax=Saccharothrix xinjiangensis TaxID=204798 RepID=A0ABV9Y468_9PSEU